MLCHSCSKYWISWCKIRLIIIIDGALGLFDPRLFAEIKYYRNFMTTVWYLYYYSSPVRENLSSKWDRFLPGRSQFDSNNHHVNFYMPTYCQSATFGLLAFCICPLFFTTKNQKEFRIATVPIFRCDLYAAVVPQMSPPPPIKNCARLRTTTND